VTEYLPVVRGINAARRKIPLHPWTALARLDEMIPVRNSYWLLQELVDTFVQLIRRRASASLGLHTHSL